MAWNQPGNNGQDNNPWGNNNNKNNQRNQRESQLQKLLNTLNGKNQSSNGSPFAYGTLVVAGLVVALGLWAVSGFYTIKEGERGVVTRFGKKLDVLVEPGLNWNPTFIDTVYPVNISTVKELEASGVMLTSDENVVRVEMNVQYQVTDPKQYLFSVTNADNSLRQATDSALRAVIGNSTMDKILTEGRTVIRDDTKQELIKTIAPYNMGLSVLDVNFQAARPPEAVRAAFDDAIAAREDEQRYIREAEAHANEIIPDANGKAAHIVAQAKAYKERVVLEAEGDVSRFERILPAYKAAPEITRERLYLEMMEKVLSKTNKILADQKSNNLMVLPLEKMLSQPASTPAIDTTKNVSKPTIMPLSPSQTSNIRPTAGIPQTSRNVDSIMQQRIENAQRSAQR